MKIIMMPITQERISPQTSQSLEAGVQFSINKWTVAILNISKYF